MGEEMQFPNTLDEFIKQYSFIDKEKIYTNGSELIQTFRIKQWEEHQERNNYKELYEKEISKKDKLKEWLEEEIKHLEKSRYISFNEYGENKLRIFKDFLFKMQEIERL